MNRSIILEKQPVHYCVRAGWVSFGFGILTSIVGIGAIFFAIAFVFGLVSILMEHIGHGIALMLMSVVGGLVSMVILAAMMS